MTMRHVQSVLSSEDVEKEIEHLLLSGDATTAHEAEERFLDTHLEEIAKLLMTLSDAELFKHEAIKLLMSHGGRDWEDSLK